MNIDPATQTASNNPTSIRRRSLLPLWMKIFIWIFIIIGSISVPAFVMGALGYHYESALYGYETEAPLSAIGIILLLLFLYKGVVAYSLWLERIWAVYLGIIDAIIGILICILAMVNISIFHGQSQSTGFRLEIIFLLPYLIKLIGIKGQWVHSAARRKT